MLNIRQFQVVITNSLLDTGVQFSLGSAAMVWPVSKEASFLNIGRAFLSFVTRLTKELEVFGCILPLPRFFRNFAKNDGASLIVVGTITSISALFALFSAVLNEGVSYFPAMALAGFASSHFGLGIAASMSHTNKHKPLVNAFGMTLSNVGLSLAVGPHAPLWIYIPYIVSATASLLLAARRESANGFLQPEYFAVVGCLIATSNALVSGYPYYAATNILYAVGYFSLDKLKKCGGLGQWFRKVLSF